MLNCFVGVAVEMGSVEVARKVFDEMCERCDSGFFYFQDFDHLPLQRVNEVSLVDQWA
ncbi:putative pentatricopeptide [Helianthus annuus]|uniref:Pentatricopeptide n=1 Tax=Helianthus annuus TaxID=4232 RepID=A0A9K3JIV2_HELAN|nr:putative pentatricopeptide [Helianthus annuus]KAJ0945141.1 putative pentatricopeptide [Helianthus annuus]